MDLKENTACIFDEACLPRRSLPTDVLLLRARMLQEDVYKVVA
jgi:hypothetical protein